MMFASSAPEAPEVMRATMAKSQSGPSLTFLALQAQNLLAALQVGQLDRHAAVKAAGAGQRRVQRFGAVGRRQNDNALGGVKPSISVKSC